MKLNNANVKPFYNSFDDNIVEDFYNETFQYATNYDRVSAYFDSKVLSLYAKGMYEIYKKGGKVRFIFSYDIVENDYEKIKEGYKNKNSSFIEEIADRINYCELSEEEKLNFENIAYLIEIGLVDIKLAFTKRGIFHDKFGIIYDDEFSVYMRGSNNETVAAILYSYESFETTCNWSASESEICKINNAKKIFKNLWNNDTKDVLVLEIPEIVKNKIISFSKGKYHDNTNIALVDKVVLDLDKKNNLIYKNFLINNIVNIKDIVFKVFLKKYFKTPPIDSLDIKFRENLNYSDLKKIIEHFENYSIEKKFELIKTENLMKYIESMDIQLEKRKSLGIDIKEQAEYLNEKFDKFSEIVNSEMERQLRVKQMWNAFHITSMLRSANFSVPGAGKTSIVYGAFAYLNREENKQVDKIIMIGPKNSFISWKEEFKLNFGEKKELKCIDVQDKKYKNKKELMEKLKYGSAQYNLILINYEKLEGLESVLKDIINEKTMLVFDEVHKIKAINGIRASSALRICEKAKYKVALTGTPIPNSYADLYNLLNILYKEEYVSYFKFQANELKNANSIKADQINEKIYPFFCRTTKKDLNIPKPNEPIVDEVTMTEEEKELFTIIRRKYRRNIFTLYIRLLQASTNPELLLRKIDEEQLNSIIQSEEDEITDDDINMDNIDNEIIKDSSTIDLIKSIGETGKFKKGIEYIRKLCEEEKQVLVWGIFVETLEKISKKLTDLGISNAIICGRTSQEDREKIINLFKNKKIQVLITNPHTLAESVSLHKTCHDAVYFEYSFNLTHMMQSKDRINRLGLKENEYTQYYYLMLCNNDIYNDSIDKRTLKRLNEKEEIMIKSIEGTKLVRTNFDDIDDIKKILETV